MQFDNNLLNSHRKSISDNIAKGFNNDIEKGGEGSKGGKVTGHTKSGKPIYDKAARDASVAKHKLLVSQHDSHKKTHESFKKNKDSNKTLSKRAEENEGKSKAALKEHMKEHHEKYNEKLDANDHTINSEMKKHYGDK